MSPQIVLDFPERYGLTDLGTKVDLEAVQTLRNGLQISREEAYRWVSDEFNTLATEVYQRIGCPELECSNGWATFNQMVAILDMYEH